MLCRGLCGVYPVCPTSEPWVLRPHSVHSPREEGRRPGAGTVTSLRSVLACGLQTGFAARAPAAVGCADSSAQETERARPGALGLLLHPSRGVVLAQRGLCVTGPFGCGHEQDTGSSSSCISVQAASEGSEDRGRFRECVWEEQEGPRPQWTPLVHECE